MKRANNEKGMTLIEIIISLLIFGIIVITLASVLSSGFLGIIRSGHKAKAAYEAQKDMSDKLIASEFSDSQTLVISFSGIPTIEIDVNLIKSEQEINGTTATMTSFIPIP